MARGATPASLRWDRHHLAVRARPALEPDQALDAGGAVQAGERLGLRSLVVRGGPLDAAFRVKPRHHFVHVVTRGQEERRANKRLSLLQKPCLPWAAVLW